MRKIFRRENIYLLGALFVLAVFGYMTYHTPLAGDDWGYALNSLKGSPLAMAAEFYHTWSGRFFSELWGFLIAPNKWAWNIINPLLFAGIFICVYKLADVKNRPLTGTLLILSLMFSVHEYVRMETYTWIMGTTYIVPLFLSLLYFVSVDHYFKKDLINRKILLGNNILLIIGGLMMENISATLVGAIFIMAVYAFFNERRMFKYLVINFVVALTAFAVMRLSPGSTFRMLRDSEAWSKLSVFAKAAYQYPNFIQMTFLDNRYLIVFLSITMIGLNVFTRKDIKMIFRIVSCIFYGFTILFMMSYFLKLSYNPLLDNQSIFSYIFWPLYCVVTLLNIWFVCDEDYLKKKALMLFVIGGTCALVMLESPIYGNRSAVYTIYYLTCLIALISDAMQYKNRIVIIPVAIILCALLSVKAYGYIYKYTLVKNANIERNEIIRYYQTHPEEKEAWIPRYPIYTLHGIDIEEGDDYHFETFKEYFNLSQDKIIFYYKD